MRMGRGMPHPYGWLLAGGFETRPYGWLLVVGFESRPYI